ncbi:sterol carrier protein domain-containing protein [Janibacter sp. GS2]|uniref:sterol carrier protein domain-containing protein n=1 Tax=Janibacter sp. GS2 TaxID=3442646 RepID=UPI003EBBEE65
MGDTILPENAGTWRWTARDGVGRLVRHDGPADLTLDIADLGAVWLGDQSVGARARAGFVTEHRAGAVAQLDAALRTATLPVASLNF